MTIKNQLFELIRSMSQTEKRYFKIDAAKYSLKEKSSYLKLFEAIDKQKSYDEKKLRLALRNEKFITRLAVEKNTLYKLILKSLENYHSGNSEESQVKHLLMEAELLFNRSLYGQCGRVLDKAEKIALLYELHPQLIDIYKWHRMLWVVKDGIHDSEKSINDEERVSREIENIIRYHRLYVAVRDLLAEHGYNLRNTVVLEKLDKIMADPLLLDESRAICIRSKQLYHGTHANYEIVQQRFNKALRHLRKQAELVELVAGSIPYRLDFYMSVRYNCLICMMHIEKENVLEELAIFRNLPQKRNIQINLRIRQMMLSTYELELSYLINYYRFEKARKLVSGIRKLIMENESVICVFRFSNICYSSAYVCFVLQEYKASYNWINEIYHRISSEEIPDYLKSCARMMSMFLQYELRNKELLAYMERSVSRFLGKKEVLFECEKITLRFFRTTLTNNILGDELKNEFVKFKVELTEVFKNPTEAKFLSYFDLISWVESKIEDRPFIELIKEKPIDTSVD